MPISVPWSRRMIETDACSPARGRGNVCVFQGHGVDRGHALVDSFCVTAAQKCRLPAARLETRRSPVPRRSPSGPGTLLQRCLKCHEAAISRRSRTFRARVLQKGKQIHGIALLPTTVTATDLPNRGRALLGKCSLCCTRSEGNKRRARNPGRPSLIHYLSYPAHIRLRLLVTVTAKDPPPRISHSFPCCACIQHGVDRPQDRSRSKFTHPWSKMRKLPRTDASGHALADPRAPS